MPRFWLDLVNFKENKNWSRRKAPLLDLLCSRITLGLPFSSAAQVQERYTS